MSVSYETVIEQFGKFGHVDGTLVYPASPIRAKINPEVILWRLTIYLQPRDVQDATDTGYRRAAYELSEKAIAFTREHYRLVHAPEFRVTGVLQLDGEIAYIDARLELEFMEK